MHHTQAEIKNLNAWQVSEQLESYQLTKERYMRIIKIIRRFDYVDFMEYALVTTSELDEIEPLCFEKVIN